MHVLVIRLTALAEIFCFVTSGLGLRNVACHILYYVVQIERQIGLFVRRSRVYERIEIEKGEEGNFNAHSKSLLTYTCVLYCVLNVLYSTTTI